MKTQTHTILLGCKQCTHILIFVFKTHIIQESQQTI